MLAHLLAIDVFAGAGTPTPDPTPEPGMEPVTLAEAKIQLRVDGTDEDDLIANLIVAAREEVEHATGLILTRRTVTEARQNFGPWLALYTWPIVSIDSIAYVDAAYAPQSVASNGWVADLNARPARLAAIGRPNALPGTSTTITMTAGYATPAEVPFMLKAAILLLIGIEYDRRAPTAEEASRLESIYGRYRMPVIG
jgi:uncharacterized phiE125 gp8 family phage protein